MSRQGRWFAWTLVAAIGWASVCVAQPARRRVALSFSPLELPEATLTKSDFVYDAHVPVLFYSGMVVPMKKQLRFRQGDPDPAITLAGNKLTIHFDGSSRFHLKAGRTDTPLKRARNGLETAVVDLGRGRKYALGFPRAFTYLQNGAIFWRSGCVQTGTVDGQPFCLYDDNADGKYTRDDLVRIGRAGAANVFAPIADHIATTGTVYKLIDLSADGSSAALAAHAGDVGKLKLSCPAKGVEGHFAIASADAKVSFGAAARNQTLTVLPGKYTLLYGLLYDAKARQVRALVVPGKAMQSVAVPKYVVPPPPKPDPKARRKPPAPKPPEPAKLPLGEGLKLEFGFKKTAEKIVVLGPVVVRGGLGEKYVGFKLDVRVQVVKEPKSPDPKKRVRPTVVDIGHFAVERDGKAGEHPCDLPKTRDGKPLTGKCILRLSAPVPGLGTAAGDRPIGLK